MRTTLVLPDELYRQVKAKAALEGKKVTELVEEGLRAVLGIAPATPCGEAHRITLPMIPKRPGQAILFAGMTQEEIHRRVSELLTENGQTDGRTSDEPSL